MKVLMIGGTRFFGKRFVQLMLDHGHAVTILTRGNGQDPFGDRVKRLHADRRDSEQMSKVINEDYDVVVDNLLMNEKEAETMISLLKDRTDHFVMTSTMAVYDPKPGALVESDFKATRFYQEETYQAGKRSAEFAFVGAPFLVSLMRIPIIVGTDDYTQRLLMHIKACKEQKKVYFPNLDAHFSYLQSQDAARALAWLCHVKLSGAFNISAPNAWTIRELIQQIERVTGEKFLLGETSDEPSPFGIPDDFYMDVSKARKAGFTVDPLDKWMPQLLRELK